MKKVFILFVAFITWENGQAQNKAVYAFSLDECVSYAQKNNVQVKNALLAIMQKIK